VFFPGQFMSAEEHIAFGRYFAGSKAIRT